MARKLAQTCWRQALGVLVTGCALMGGCAGDGKGETLPGVSSVEGPAGSTILLPTAFVGPPRDPWKEAQRDPRIVVEEMKVLSADLRAGRKKANELTGYDKKLYQMMLVLEDREQKRKGKSKLFK